MSKKKGNGKIIAAAVIAAGMVAGTVAAGIILPQTNYVNITCYGNNDAPVYEQRVRKNSAVVLPTPERDGFNFDGWYLNEEMTDAVTYGTKFNKNTKVYAGWELTAEALADDPTTLAETTGITKIGAGAFKGCTGLTNVTIPASVTAIGTGAFEGCNITNLYIEGDIYKTATSANSLGGALTAAQNVFVKESIELSTRNIYFLEGTSFYYAGTANNYVHFSKDSRDETKFRIKYFSPTGLLDDEDVCYRGSAQNAPALAEKSGVNVVVSLGWYTENGGTQKVDLIEIRENKNAYRTTQKVVESFNASTWEEVKVISDSGLASECYKVGDEKKITLTDGTSLTIQIADFNHDVDANGNTIGITCVTKELLPSKYNYNMYNSNDNINGWESSDMRSYLNNDILNLLPTELKNNIVATVKKSQDYKQYNSLIQYTNDRLFLLSCSEINYNSSADVYELFANWPTSNTNCAIRVKQYAGTTTTSPWFLRDRIGYNDYFWIIDDSSMGNSAGVVYYVSPLTKYAICFAFCI